MQQQEIGPNCLVKAFLSDCELSSFPHWGIQLAKAEIFYYQESFPFLDRLLFQMGKYLLFLILTWHWLTGRQDDLRPYFLLKTACFCSECQGGLEDIQWRTLTLQMRKQAWGNEGICPKMELGAGSHLLVCHLAIGPEKQPISFSSLVPYSRPELTNIFFLPKSIHISTFQHRWAGASLISF